ncbi:MAG: transcriptional regulator [Holophagales bacterium]|nr:transcriptional regulator [Holophagales bacterium]
MDLPPPFEFDAWRAEPERNSLISGDGEIRLGSRVMAVLVFLAGNAGRVVSRDELLASVWEGRAVTDDALTVAVHDLRKALGDRASDPRFVETIPGRGYRWLVPTRQATLPETVSWSSTARQETARPEAGGRSHSPAEAHAERSPTRRKLAARGRQLAVLGLALGAVGVLAVGFREDGWLRQETQPISIYRGSIHPEIPQLAQDAHLVGIEAACEMTPAAFAQAAGHFERAAELAPDFALARVHLADSLLNLSFFPDATRSELTMRAREAAREAVALDPTLPNAHLVLGVVQLFVDWDLEAAEQSALRAIQLDTDYPASHERYARVLATQGRFGAAEVRLRHAHQLASSLPLYSMMLGELLVLVGKPAETLELLTPSAVWEPPLLHHAWHHRSRALQLLGREAEACAAELEFLRRALPELGLAPYRSACYAGGLAALRELWLETLEEPTSLYLRAIFNLELGRVDAALSWLWQMHRERDPQLLWIVHDSRFVVHAEHLELRRLSAAIGPYDPDDPPSRSATSHPSWLVRAR